MEIEKIYYNWFFSEENGEEYYIWQVGKNGCKHIARIENFYRVYFDDGSQIDIYNPNKVFRKKLSISSTEQKGRK